MNVSPSELEFWGFLLAVLGLFLGIPFGIAAILMAPKVEQQWASRSQKSRAVRLQTLLKEQAEVRDIPMMSETEDHMLTATVILGCIVTGNSAGVLFGVAEMFLVFSNFNNDIRRTCTVLLMVYVSVFLWYLILCFRPLNKYRKQASPVLRARAAKELKELSERLDKTPT